VKKPVGKAKCLAEAAFSKRRTRGWVKGKLYAGSEGVEVVKSGEETRGNSRGKTRTSREL